MEIGAAPLLMIEVFFYPPPLSAVPPSHRPPRAQAEWLYKGTMDCFAKIVKDEGLSAMFKGAGANALRTVGAALVLVFYRCAPPPSLHPLPAGVSAARRRPHLASPPPPPTLPFSAHLLLSPQQRDHARRRHQPR